MLYLKKKGFQLEDTRSQRGDRERVERGGDMGEEKREEEGDGPQKDQNETGE